MPLFAPKISVVPGQVGLILTVSIFLMAIFQVPLGRMADRGSATRMILAGSIVSAASLILIPQSTSFWDLFLAASANGLGSALMMPALMALTVKIGKKIGMGMITAPLLGGMVMDAFSINAVFILGGTIGVGATVVTYIVTRRALGTVEFDDSS
jgi:MFS family permease